jgi:hypothetical protein
MKSVKHTVFGPFVARELGNGFWQLTAGAPAASEIYVQITGPGAADALKDMSVSRLDLEWRDGVTLALTGTNGIGYLKAKTAIVHEPKDRLYDSLPLAGFDLKAKRFWRRAFILMRFPGGRLLLGIIARRNRS